MSDHGADLWSAPSGNVSLILITRFWSLETTGATRSQILLIGYVTHLLPVERKYFFKKNNGL